MLSNKMTVSLMSLITILVLGFIAMPALAAKISIEVKDLDAMADDQKDISFKDGIQAIYGATVTLLVKTDEVFGAVDTTADTGTASAFQFVQDPVADSTATPAIPEASIATTDGIVRSGDGKQYTVTLATVAQPADRVDPIKVSIYLQPNSLMSLTTGTASHDGASITIEYIPADPADAAGVPSVISAMRSDGATHPVFEETFTVIVTLSEEPKTDTFTNDKHPVSAKEASVVSVNFVGDVAVGATGPDGTADNADDPSGGDLKHYRYAVTLKPAYAKTDDIKLTVGHFEDQFGKSTEQAPGDDPPLKEQAFKVAPSAVAAKAGTAGTSIGISDDLTIPAGGFLIVAKDDGDGANSMEKTSESLIAWPGDPKATAANVALRVPKFRTYNVIEAGLPNLETFLINGGTIDLIAPDKVIVTEIMWGTDAGSQNRQWIEIMNTTAAAITTKGYKFMLYDANEAVPPGTAAVAATATTAAVPASPLPAGVADRVGTIYKGAYWSIAGKGQSGNIAGTIAIAGQDVEVVGATPLISMQRGKADAKGMYPMGNMAGSWMQSTPPSQNIHADGAGLIVATPGASPIISDAAAKAAADAAAKAAADAAKPPDTSVMVPKVGQIYISEIMFAGGGTLPQWLEISNGSRTEEVNLSGWTITVDNAAADADVSVGASIMFTIPEGTKIHPSGQNDYPSTLLVVTEAGRNNLTGAMAAGQVLNIWETQQTELILGGVTKRRYSLLSGMAFQVTLAPPVPITVPAKAAPAPTTAAEIAAARAADAAKKAAAAKEALARAAATDTVGNLGADGAAAWALPMNEDGGRSSLIRRHVPVSIGPAEPEDGTMMDSWALASDTSFAQVTHIRASSYYGAANDVGTPGFRAGGALPVELSHFRPERKKDTGQVVITWSTQSELNNAGFFIKRSQQKDGEFKVINATMVPGAGTTSEKQFYTYTDTTAQPNVVYYYQIEDVSLDGNRQTLTRGIRLKGHIGAAGKLTSTWGEIKTSNE